MVSVILGNYHSDVCSSVNFSDKLIVDAIKWECDVKMSRRSQWSSHYRKLKTDWVGWLYGRDLDTEDPSWSLLHRLWSQVMSLVQDGSVRIWDILVSLLYSGRKWRRVVHLYIQSMVQIWLHHFWLQKNKMATARMLNSRLQNGNPQISGWCHGGYIHFFYTVHDQHSK